MSIRRIPHTSRRAFRPAYDDLEGRRLMSSAMVPRGPTPGDINAPSAPAIAAFNDKIYMASVNGYHGVPFEIESSSDGGLTFGNKVDLPEKTESSPALTAFDGRLYIAWRGDNSAHQVNVESSSNGVDFGNKVLFPENTIGSPALTVFDRRLYVAWTGTDHRLNVESSSNGVNFGNKVTLPESSDAGPALTGFGSDLEIAWAGTDKDHHLNVESSSNGVNFGNKVSLRETNIARRSGVQPAPALASFSGGLYIAWKGTDERLNVEASNNGVTFAGKSIYSRSAEDTGPELADVGGSLDMAWTSDTNPHVVHQVTTIAGAKNA
jgi:hypothetical protein